ncbi:hypothetical protein [Streptomyces sp. NPDC006267]|uniref:golvesin C-terminal-like domain-containing protein n=1 Tax=Streptomyces sp. NPDC006267 TaxID=3157173 RepID=UPI00339DB2EE
MVIAATAMLGGLVQSSAQATDSKRPKEDSLPSPASSSPAELPSAQRGKVLGKDYKKSGDLAWTTASDAQGFHVLTAKEKDGYAWKTTASLSEPGFDTDAWIGNACVTGSGNRAVVVYAPRTFTNKPELMARGAFTAIVDLKTGEVTKLALQASLAYYNPGCGVTEDVVLTQSGGEDKAATRLFALDASTGKIAKPVETKGQVTSAVMAKDGAVVGANGARIVKIDTDGSKTTLVNTDSVPYRLAPDAAGGLVFLDKLMTKPQGSKASRSASGGKSAGQQRTRAKRVTAGAIATPRAKKNTASLLAEGPLTQTGLATSAGTVFLTGKAKAVSGTKLPDTVRQLAAAPKDARVSTRGEAVLTETAWTDGQGTLLRADEPDASRPVNVKLTVVDSGEQVEFTVDPAKKTGPKAIEGRERSPALAAPRSGGAKKQSSAKGASPKAATTARVLAAGDRNEVVESERVCSVPRNDPRNQAMQPKPRQVEWAVNQAIRNKLNTHVSRPANWKNLGMPAYQPQTLFPYPTGLLNGATIPAQVMLGITAQESNMWQAARSAVPGVTGNPLIGNYYGVDYYDGLPANDWDVNWAKADCGYGITQVTDHMRLAGREDGHGGAAWDYQKQRAVALDYTANVAAGLHILADKWNQTSSAGLKVNNGNSAKLENWTFALWAYNSGFYPDKGDGSPWGLGWANNPANPEWDAGRSPFMEDSAGNEEAADAAHPQDWPYQEKVLGFAAHPPAFLESPGKMVPAYRAAWWNGKEGGASIEGSAVRNRALVKPPEDTFCDKLINSCNPEAISDDAQNELFFGPCNRGDFKCWWNKSVQWKDDCDYSCGNDFTRFPVSWAEEPDGTAYPPNCTTGGLPAGALIIDDLPQGTPSVRPECSNSSWSNKGAFSFDFGEGEKSCDLCNTTWPSKIDLHQIGAGFGGHFYFGHTRKGDAKGERLKITGSWKLGQKITSHDGQAKVYAHIPDHGAQTAEAIYKIKTSNGVETKTISQTANESNKWVDLGAYFFHDMYPEVSLSTVNGGGTGDADIAWDAIALVPGDYSGMPSDLTFGDPDVNAPEPAAVEPPSKISGRFFELVQGASKSARKAGVPRIEASPSSERKLSTVAARISTADTATCSVNEISMSYTRTQACIVEEIFINQPASQGNPAKSAGFNYRHEIDLDTRSDTFTQKVTISLKSMINANSASMDVDFLCRGHCQLESPKWSGTKTFTKGDTRLLTATQKTKWTKGSDYSRITPHWSFKGFLDSVRTKSTPKAEKPELDVRCDKEVLPVTPGCVFSWYKPTYKMNHKKFPAASAHAWLVQNNLPGNFGLRGKGEPLKYLSQDVLVPGDPTDKSIVDHNRDTVCPTSWERNTNTTLSPELSTKPDTPSCDEFPFAASWQHAAIPKSWGGKNPKNVTSGEECLNTYAKRGTDGRWRLLPDPRSPVPTWNEPCGRASMSKNQNSLSMLPFGNFRKEHRIIEGDDYWLDAPKP